MGAPPRLAGGVKATVIEESPEDTEVICGAVGTMARTLKVRVTGVADA